jgi:hypothetical protein
MNKLLFLLLLITFSIELFANNSCTECHNGIEHIRDPNSKMMQEILKVANKAGEKGNDCVVCHGGNPSSDDKNLSHSGTVNYFKSHKGPKEFYPLPTSQWININTCGMCHEEQVKAQWNSLMNTEAGKIHGALWSFGKSDGYNHTESNYNSKNPHERLGTKTYQEYMKELSKKEPQAFPKESTMLPKAPTAEEVERDPLLSVYTYLRQECLRCHTGGKGRSRRGDFRGMGCASCHIPYSNEGFYEGNDTKIPHDKAGHMLTHQIQSSRKVKVNIHGTKYSGVPVETCTTCHNRGKRIGVSYQGLMETEYQSTFDAEGNGQPKLHTKRYLHLTEDIHYSKGMLCQDCHTSNDMHGDGFMTGANLGAVEIECQDCHGTTKKYPWELPLGYSDEFALTPKEGKGRGTTKTLAEYLKKGAIPKDTGDGFLLSARGNPLTKVVRHGDKIIMHLASGKDIELTPLKRLKEDEKLSKKALVAMDKIEAHTNKLECYTCHATWAPQCYGCHVKIDYSNGKQNPDYLAASHAHDVHGNTGEKSLKDFLVDGKVTETRSYLRWENPALSVNGEGRVSPTIPGCQTTITVIGKDGKALLQNHIVKIPNVEGAGAEGQNAITMSQVNPHTISKKSRSCESCHTSKKALGMGINGGKYFADQTQTAVIDLMTADGKVLPKKVDEQIPAIPNLKHDYSVMIDENGTQVQTVDNHWSLANPLSAKQRSKLDREGACYSCHQAIPKGDLAISAMNHISNMAGVEIDKEMHNDILNKTVKLSAWVQIGLPLLFGLGFMLWFIGRKIRR